ESRQRHRDLAARIEHTIHRRHTDFRDLHNENPLMDIGDYVLESHGKMLRCFTLVEACRAVGGDPERVLNAAAGAEYGHIASLVQALETRLAQSGWVPKAQYLKMIRHKTASLFRACAESGAILGGGTADQVLAVRGYGESLGMAFQIADDVSGYTRDDAELLK